MNKKLIFPVLLIVIGALAIFGLPGVIQSQAEKKLNALGFKNAIIGQTSVKMNGVTFSNITLKRSITAKNIRIEGTPLHAFGFLPIERIDITGLKIEQNARDLVHLIRTNKGLSAANLPADIIKITDSSIVVPLKGKDALNIDLFGRVRREGAVAQTSFSLMASKATLDFDIKVIGSIGQTSTQLDAAINNINAQHKLASINRAAGWFSYKQDNGYKPEIFGQIDAGSGSVTTIPTKNMSAVIGEEGDNYTLILRAQAAGIEGTDLLSDMTFGGSSSDITMHTALSIKDTKSFFDYLKTVNVKTEDLAKLKSVEEAELTIDYLPEKRFVDGPLPFDIMVKGKKLSDDVLKGTFLIYPKDMTVRGNAQTSETYTSEIQTLLSISEEKVSGTTIRLDGSLKGLF